MPLHHFLIIYDASRQELIEASDLGHDLDAAVATYTLTEREYDDRNGIEIVLIGADSLETVQQTHSHYFAAVDDFFSRVVA
jgi:hypothetical protein